MKSSFDLVNGGVLVMEEMFSILLCLSFISNSSPGAFYQQSVLCIDNWQLLLVFVSSVVMELQGDQ